MKSVKPSQTIIRKEIWKFRPVWHWSGTQATLNAPVKNSVINPAHSEKNRHNACALHLHIWSYFFTFEWVVNITRVTRSSVPMPETKENSLERSRHVPAKLCFCVFVGIMSGKKIGTVLLQIFNFGPFICKKIRSIALLVKVRKKLGFFSQAISHPRNRVVLYIFSISILFIRTT